MYYRFIEKSFALVEGCDPFKLVVEVKIYADEFREEFGISSAYYATFQPDGWAYDLRRMRLCA